MEIQKKVRNFLKLINRRICAHCIDLGSPGDFVILAGMGISGTTWAGELINYNNNYRMVFEPFLPQMVNEAKSFDYLQYLSPQSINPVLADQAKLILAGKVRNSWVDGYNSRLVYRRRIIKDIRCNLMLGWLRQANHHAPLILIIRHPLQIVSTWSTLGWGQEAFGERSEFDIIMSKAHLLQDFPIIGEVVKQINVQDVVENIVFQWCIYHLVPAYHLKQNEAHTLFYENLLTNPEDEVNRLFNYLGEPFEYKKLQKQMKRSSDTNYRQRDFAIDQKKLLNSWKDDFSSKQIQRANYILEAFGLDHIYNQVGLPTDVQLVKK